MNRVVCYWGVDKMKFNLARMWDYVPGSTTKNDSWKPYVRHIWLYGFFDTIHKTIQKFKRDLKWRLSDHVVQQKYRSWHWPSTIFFFYGALDTISKTTGFYGPSKIIKLFLCNITFWLRIAINNVQCGFQTKNWRVENCSWKKNMVSWIPFPKP